MPQVIVPLITIGGGFLLQRKARKQQEQAQSRAEEFARDQAEEAKVEQVRLEEKFGLTPGELEREERTFALEQTRITEAQRRAGLTGEELLREAGPETRRLLDTIAERFDMTGEELFKAEGEIPTALAEQVLAGVQEPSKFFEDTLKEQLELARTQINAEAQRRGVFGGRPEGGIRFEMLGRAGVELAIKSAREKEAARQQGLSNAFQLAQQFEELSSIARGEAGTVGERSLSEQERARTELDTLLANVQGLSERARGRAAEVGIQARQVTEPGRAFERETISDIEGIRIGEAQARERAGLELIGQGVGDIFGGAGLPTPAKATTPPTPTNFEFLQREQRKKRLGGLTELTGAANLRIS